MAGLLHFLQIIWKPAICIWLSKSYTPEAEFHEIGESQGIDDFAPVVIREYVYRDLQCMRSVQAVAKSERYEMHPGDCPCFAHWLVLPVSGNLVGTPPRSLRVECAFPGIDKPQSDDDLAPVVARENFDRVFQYTESVQARANPDHDCPHFILDMTNNL